MPLGYLAYHLSAAPQSPGLERRLHVICPQGARVAGVSERPLLPTMSHMLSPCSHSSFRGSGTTILTTQSPFPAHVKGSPAYTQLGQERPLESNTRLNQPPNVDGLLTISALGFLWPEMGVLTPPARAVLVETDAGKTLGLEADGRPGKPALVRKRSFITV